MKKLILTLFAVMLACSPLLAESTTVKPVAAHSHLAKAKHKKNHKKKGHKKKSQNSARKKKNAASPKAEAA
jgi:Ni/Co efflux regulator RcnB